MKVSCIKFEKDEDSFRFFKGMGVKVIELKELDEVDNTIQHLIDKKYDTFILSNEVAGFSEDIIKRYWKDKQIRIVISPSKSK